MRPFLIELGASVVKMALKEKQREGTIKRAGRDAHQTANELDKAHAVHEDLNRRVAELELELRRTAAGLEAEAQRADDLQSEVFAFGQTALNTHAHM